MNIKASIEKAAFELFSQRRFRDITVQDIIEKAECSRYTFYRYYSDKYELLYLYYTTYVTDLLMNEYQGDNYPEIQARIFQFIVDNEAYFDNVTGLSGTDSFWSFLDSYATEFFSKVYALNTGNELETKQERYEMLFVVNGAISVFKRYVEDKTGRMTPAQVSQMLCDHYPREYYVLPGVMVDEFKKSFDPA